MDAHNDAKRRIELGRRYPYDAADDGTPPKTVGWQYDAARGIIADLTDRRGIKFGFDDLDPDVRREIIEQMAAIILICSEDHRHD